MSRSDIDVRVDVSRGNLVGAGLTKVIGSVLAVRVGAHIFGVLWWICWSAYVGIEGHESVEETQKAHAGAFKRVEVGGKGRRCQD